MKTDIHLSLDRKVVVPTLIERVGAWVLVVWTEGEDWPPFEGGYFCYPYEALAYGLSEARASALSA